MNIQINPQQGYQAGNATQISSTSEFIESQLLNAEKQLNLATGTILSGRITEMKGNNILLLLDNGQSLSATLSGNMDIGVGRALSFEVKSTVGNQTELRPLYTNLTATPTVMSALSEASLPPTERNIVMVQNMMEEGMSVSKQALLDMVSHLNDNPTINVETLVQMQKLGLRMDESTIHQVENYKNFEHKILGDVLNLSEGLSSVFDGLAENVNEEIALTNASEVLEMIIAQENDEDAANVPVKTDENTVKEAISNLNELLEQIKPDKADVQETLDNTAGALANNQIIKDANMLIKMYLSNPEVFSKEDKEAMKELLSNPGIKDMVKDSVNKMLTLRPEEIKEEGKVDALYKKILEMGNKSLDILNNSGLETSQAAKSAQNLMDNVQFMNQLNEMMTYVQLPLKFSEENAHGDLYVYTNKKKLAEKDGNFSALLHLDMEHLGPMDVYVAMQQEKVSTHFYMQDEETLDFIEANIHILNDRLTKKGYNMNTVVSVKEDNNKSMVETFLEDKSSDGTVAPVLSTLSFDVRA